MSLIVTLRLDCGHILTSAVHDGRQLKHEQLHEAGNTAMSRTMATLVDSALAHRCDMVSKDNPQGLPQYRPKDEE